MFRQKKYISVQWDVRAVTRPKPGHNLTSSRESLPSHDCKIFAYEALFGRRVSDPRVLTSLLPFIPLLLHQSQKVNFTQKKWYFIPLHFKHLYPSAGLTSLHLGPDTFLVDPAHGWNYGLVKAQPGQQGRAAPTRTSLAKSLKWLLD